ncbi:MAG: formate-dependent phosphoribosylglycinamide formyltransferase [Thermoplasmata archaeon]|nr:formate-dependent phosphoribosylglycinamide formyltransferase [Thermoplasmata archaeon]
MPERRRAGVVFRDRIGTPLVGDAPKLMLLGSGELGREIAIEAMRLGAEVIAVDRYAGAPAMQVAHRHHVLPMTDGAGLRALVRRECPDLLVPEIEQIDTAELLRLEADGWTVIPTAEATRATMDRERIRRLAVEQARVPTSRFEFVEGPEEATKAAQRIGFPCLFKAITSSSGHGMTLVRGPDAVASAYQEAAERGRVANPRIMIEEFLRFDLEVTLLTLRHFDRAGRPATTIMAPIGHARPGTLYHESWQPADLPGAVVDRLDGIARAVTDQLGGIGLYGVECFVRGADVFFSEVSPRPHDTGLVTLGSQWNSEFALHARAILGLPFEGPEPTVPAAAHVILGGRAGAAPNFGGLSAALGPSGVRLYLFGKPESYPDRRLGVAVARGASIAEARELAAGAAHRVEGSINVSSAGAGALPTHR